MKAAPVLAASLALALAACGSKQAGKQQGNQVSNGQVLTGKEAGVTPMAERVAIIGILNKRNGIVHNLKMKPGMAVRVKDAILRLRACETTAPWEAEKLTGAFLQLDVQGADKKYRRVFSGWVYKESPSLNVVQHPVYDVWPKSCAMTFPAGPAAPAPPTPSSNESKAQNSPGPAKDSPAAEPAAETASPSAVANNAE